MCSASLDRLIGFKGSSRTLVLGKLLVKAKWNPLFRHYLEPKMCNRHMAISGRGMEVFCTFPFNFGTITLVFVGWLAGWLVECSHGKGVLRKTGGNWSSFCFLTRTILMIVQHLLDCFIVSTTCKQKILAYVLSRLTVSLHVIAPFLEGACNVVALLRGRTYQAMSLTLIHPASYQLCSLKII